MFTQEIGMRSARLATLPWTSRAISFIDMKCT